MTHHYDGSCHCGSLRVAVDLTRPAQDYSPRACDCRFCLQHGAAYVSDPEGHLTIAASDPRSISRYRQGSGIADFWICQRCGVLLAVCYEESGTVYAAFNRHALPDVTEWAAEQLVSPKTLPDSERVARWKTLWFHRVSIRVG